MPFPINPVADEEINDGEPGERYQLRPDPTEPRLIDKYLLERFGTVVSRH